MVYYMPLYKYCRKIIHMIKKIRLTVTVFKYIVSFIFFQTCFLQPLLAQVNLYSAPQGLKPSEDYEVLVNGKKTFVYASPVPASWCSFDLDGAADITIKANRDIKWVDVRPEAAGIQTTFKDSTIKLRLGCITNCRESCQ